MSIRRIVTGTVLIALLGAAIVVAPAFAQPTALAQPTGSAPPRACEQTLCLVTPDDAAPSGVPVLRGWKLHGAYFLRTAGGATASVPTVELTSGEDWVVLNGRQVTAMTCERHGRDEICASEPVSERAIAQMLELLRWRAGR